MAFVVAESIFAGFVVDIVMLNCRFWTSSVRLVFGLSPPWSNEVDSGELSFMRSRMFLVLRSDWSVIIGKAHERSAEVADIVQ